MECIEWMCRSCVELEALEKESRYAGREGWKDRVRDKFLLPDIEVLVYAEPGICFFSKPCH